MPKIEMVGAATAFFVILVWLFWRLFGWSNEATHYANIARDPHKAKLARVLSVVFGAVTVVCVVLVFALCLMGAYLALTQ